MLRSSFLASALALTGTFAVAQTALAQSYQPQMAPAPTPDADALADAMRQLAGAPRDLAALITAGELSLKVGDASGAAALFRRAEQVDPMNGRIKAGMARILVTQERPGEALRYFDQAVGYGLDPRTFAGDRGLAYDLIGEQQRAQRDYRLALKGGDNDEVRRRYALSLAISGNQLGAFEQIEPLTRRNDRGAWRARAFVLAMTGDVAGANRIAQGMMPPGMAQGLAPFFARLPALSPTDKAFAVHFGEVSATPQRLADARLTPTLVALGPDPDARPTAIVVPSPPPQNPRGRRGRGRTAPARVEVASVAPRAAAATPGFGASGQSPTDPVRTPKVPAPVRATAAQTTPSALPAAVSVAAAPRTAPAPVRFAREDVDPIQKATLADYARVQRYNEALARRQARLAQTAPAPSSPVPVRVVIATPSPVPSVAAGTWANGGLGSAARSDPVPVATAAIPSAAVAPAPVTTPPAASNTQVAATTPPAFPPSAQATAPPVPSAPNAPLPVAPSPVAPATPVAQVAASSSSIPTPLAANENAILARIVQGLTIPGAELGVAAPPAPASVSASLAAVSPIAAAPVSTVAARTAPEPGSRAPVTAALTSASAAAVTPNRPMTRRATSSRGEAAPIEVADAAPTRRGVRARDAAADARAIPARTGRRGAVARTAAAEEPADAPPSRTRHGKRAAADTRTVAKDEADAPVSARGRRGDRRAVVDKDDDAPAARGRSRSAARPAIAEKDSKDRKAAGAEPSRIWVQVAGGANAGDLPKAYSAVQSRTPALKGRAAYSTPLRATNRVVTGPFKTDAEARAFVNQLAKQGVSAFPFTSDKGQKMAKLPPR